jgi:hypothetical protein
MNDEFDRMWKEEAAVCFKVCSRHLPGGTEEMHGNLSQDSQCPYQYKNRALLEYEPRSCRSTNLLGPSFNVCLVLLHVIVFFSTGSTAPLGPGLWFFNFIIILQTVGLLGRVISSSQGLYLNSGQQEHGINTCTYQISMPCVGFEPTIAASERAKTVHALDRSAIVTGLL